MAEKFAEIKQIPPERFVKLCDILCCHSVSEAASRAGKCRQRGSLDLGRCKAHTASFIGPSHVVNDVKSGDRVPKAVSKGNVNALLM